MIKKQFILSLLILIFFSCNKTNNERDKNVDKFTLMGDDYRLFQNTPAWEFAKAVEDEDESKINDLLSENKKLINYREPIFKSTFLMMTVKNQQYKSFEILLKNKADVNLCESNEGSSVLMIACSSKYYDIKFPKMLLQYGANVNDVQIDIEKQGKTKTPLMLASKTGKLELVKLLVKNGANINYQNYYGQSALSESIMVERYNIASYLINEGANYKVPIFYREEVKKNMYLVDVLREDFFDLDTDEYKYKMEIVAFLKNKGIDYRAAPIPEYIKKKAQQHYPNNWEKYLEKY